MVKCDVPKFYVKTFKEDDDDVIELEDVYAIILKSVIGYRASKRSRRCELEGWRNVSQTVVVIIDQDTLENSDFDQFAFLNGNNLRRLTVRMPELRCGTELYYGLLRIETPLVDQLREILGGAVDVDGKRVNADATGKGSTKLDLLLSPVEMVEENFPMPNYYPNFLPGYVHSRKTYSTPTARSPIYAIDCEMCLAKNRQVLTRISIVDEHIRVVFDTLVKPDAPITDYLTRFSGITPEMMADVTTSLKDVQRALANLLEPDAILCGHSLNGDLKAMQVFHPYVIDTSVAYLSGRRERKSALRVLASTYLGGKRCFLFGVLN